MPPESVAWKYLSIWKRSQPFYQVLLSFITFPLSFWDSNYMYWDGDYISYVFIYCVMCFFFFFFATPMACGNSQARDQTQATAVTRATAVTMLWSLSHWATRELLYVICFLSCCLFLLHSLLFSSKPISIFLFHYFSLWDESNLLISPFIEFLIQLLQSFNYIIVIWYLYKIHSSPDKIPNII